MCGEGGGGEGGYIRVWGFRRKENGRRRGGEEERRGGVASRGEGGEEEVEGMETGKMEERERTYLWGSGTHLCARMAEKCLEM